MKQIQQKNIYQTYDKQKAQLNFQNHLHKNNHNKKHYQNLTYEIKDEKIDGNKATVTAEIEVTDYTNILEEADKVLKETPEKFQDESKNFDESKFMDYRLEKLKDASDTVTYTVNFHLTKKDGTWEMDPLSDEQEQKIHGMYRNER